MSEPLDARLRDDEALEEIELTSNLMIAALESEGDLGAERIDDILGLGGVPASGPGEHAAAAGATARPEPPSLRAVRPSPGRHRRDT